MTIVSPTEKLKLLTKAKESVVLQWAIIEQCKRDIFYWFDNFAYTENVKGFSDSTDLYIPFVLFDFQIDFVKGLWEAMQDAKRPIGERTKPSCNVFIEKSRQMGLSWIVSAVFFYAFNFHNYKIHMISEKSDLVDKSWDMKSLFEKLRFLIDHTPSWMMPTWLKNKQSELNKFMTISKPGGQSSITWESANQDAGRGGSYDAIFLDEFAFVQNAVEINRSCQQATQCIIYNSTPNGTRNEFYRMREKAEKGVIRGFTFHWSEHPHYDQAWYELQCANSDPVSIAQELDIDYRASVVWAVYPQFADGRVTIGKYEYDPNLPLYVSQDNSHGGNDNFAVLVWQENLKTQVLYLIDALQFPERTTPEQVASFMGKKPLAWLHFSQPMREFYSRWVDYKTPQSYIADPYDTDVALGNSSIKQDFEKYSIHLSMPTFAPWMRGNIIEQVRLTTKLLPQMRINETCIEFLDAIFNARWKPVTENSTSLKQSIIHDLTSHYRTALEYFGIWYTNDKQKRPINKGRELRVEEIYNPITGRLETKIVR